MHCVKPRLQNKGKFDDTVKNALILCAYRTKEFLYCILKHSIVLPDKTFYRPHEAPIMFTHIKEQNTNNNDYSDFPRIWKVKVCLTIELRF